MLMLEFAQIHVESLQVTAELGIELPPRLARLLNDGVFHDSAFHELLRSIDQRRLKTMTSSNRVYSRNCYSIRNMRAVPGQEVVETVRRGRCDVKRIFVCFLRNTSPSYQGCCKFDSFASDLGEPEISRDFDTCRSQSC